MSPTPRRYMPVERGFSLTSGFEPRWGTFHWGNDYGRDGGSGGFPIFAAQAGIVTAAGPASGFGKWITLDHPTEAGGGLTVYGHIIPEVRAGDRVEAGQRIGHINPDQNTNGGVAPHLHFEVDRYVWSPPGPDRLDPTPWLDGARWPGDRPKEEVTGMDANVLARAMGNSLPLERYAQLLPAFTAALIAADCTTVNRVAMFCAQVGHESGGLRWMEEIADGSAYEGRTDLGNTAPGDGRRYKGHGPIQITGRYNHTKVSEWAHGRGLVPTSTYFVDNPGELAGDEYGFLGVVWYWTVARNMNALADAGDINGATRAVNGGLNGLADRTDRWNQCLALGDALLPNQEDTPMSAAEVKQVQDFVAGFCGPIGQDTKDIRQQLTGGRDGGEYPGWPQLGGRTVVDALALIGAKLGIDGFTAPQGGTR
ncbi:peptidoglycan DD-metalloendopeptidase family protein [Rhodococcus jostii]|uniref:peptidoglycan DD-metalloendopeptidase family protein n=1 Tax=Rhodococcus jostii TaxID=132919 RepID=UPI00363FA590